MPPKRQYPPEMKLRVVKETLAPGASVSVVARRHNINSNVVFRWRKEYREGHLGENTAAAFIPIRVVKDAPVPALPAPAVSAVPETTGPASRAKPGAIELGLPGGFTLRVDEDIDEAALRRVLRAVRDTR
ncbi:MAG: transposase [Rhodospirillales bacterium]|nr:transposase [Rhodospirillales bacterium]